MYDTNRLTQLRLPTKTLIHGKFITTSRTCTNENPNHDNANNSTNAHTSSDANANTGDTDIDTGADVQQHEKSTAIPSIIVPTPMHIHSNPILTCHGTKFNSTLTFTSVSPRSIIDYCKSKVISMFQYLTSRDDDDVFHEDGLYQDDRQHHPDDIHGLQEQVQSSNDNNSSSSGLALDNTDGKEQDQNMNTNTSINMHSSRLASRLKRDGIDIGNGIIDPNIHNENNHPPIDFDINLMPTIEEEEDYIENTTSFDSKHGQRQLALVINIRKMKITSHPLMIPEEQNAQELIQLYEKYKEMKRDPCMQYYYRRSMAIISKLVQMKNRQQQIATGDEDEKTNHDDYEYNTNSIMSRSKLAKTLHDELKSCLSRMVSVQYELYNIHASILLKWQEICKMRSRQGYSSTNVVLVQRKMGGYGHSGHDRRKGGTGVDVEMDISTLLLSMEEVMVWMKNEIVPDSAGIPSVLTSDREMEEIQKMMKVVESSFAQCHSCELILKHGEECVGVPMSSSHANVNVNANVECFKLEQRRRDTVRLERYVARVIVNHDLMDVAGGGGGGGKNVDWPSWEVQFDNTVRCIVGRVPYRVCVQIYKRRCIGMGMGINMNLLPDELISSVYVAVPGNYHDGRGGDSNWSVLDLSAPSVDWYRFSQEEGHKKGQIVKGVVEVESHWEKLPDTEDSGEDDAGRIFADGDLNVAVKPYLTDSSHLQGTKPTGFGPEPDRKNRVLTGMDSSKIMSLNETSMSFCLRGTRFLYVNSERFQEPIRHSLIRRRESLKQRIPLTESDVDEETIKSLIAYSESNYKSQDDLVEAACKERKACDPQNVKDFIEFIRQMKDVDVGILHNHVAYEDFVHDESRIRAQDPPQDLSWILNSLFPPRKRSLYPNSLSTYHEPKRRTQVNQQSRIIVTIVSASDTPLRDGMMISSAAPFLAPPPSIRRLTSTRASGRVLEADSFRRQQGMDNRSRNLEDSLNPIVQISFCGKKYQSRTGDRLKLNPTWKEVIEIPLPFCADGKEENFTPQKLRELEESLEVTLFDIVESSIERSGETLLLTEKRFLGSLNVELSSAFQDLKQQGAYILNAPNVIFGYTSKGKNMELETQDSWNASGMTTRRQYGFLEMANDVESQRRHTGLSETNSNIKLREFPTLGMFITIEPSIQITDSSQASFPSIESPTMMDYTAAWMQRYSKINPCGNRRQAKIISNASNGRQTLITRFLQPQVPPPECQASMHQCAHFVRLIPFLRDWKAVSGISRQQQVWLTSQKVLDINAGDWNARAALLANYFMYMQEVGRNLITVKVYLVMGSSISEGQVVYVMTVSSSSERTFWNPATGKYFSENDERCPLTNITLLVSAENIYANLQAEGKPCLMDFDDLQDKKCWDSFIESIQDIDSDSLPSPIQEPILEYREPNAHFAATLEEEILDKVKTSIRSWRKIPTGFNSDISAKLRIIITDLEERTLNGVTIPSASEYFIALESLCRGKKIFGFPLHFGYSSSQEILDAVSFSGIHENEHPDVEFSISVKVFPYPCNVFSVWVFLASLTPNYST